MSPFLRKGPEVALVKLDFRRVNDEEEEDDSDRTGGGLSLPAGEKVRAHCCLGLKGGVSRSGRLVLRF